MGKLLRLRARIAAARCDISSVSRGSRDPHRDILMLPCQNKKQFASIAGPLSECAQSIERLRRSLAPQWPRQDSGSSMAERMSD